MSMLNYAQFGMKGHNGADIAGIKGTPIVAPCKLWTGWINADDRGYGLHIFAETETIKLNGVSYKLELCFGHFDEITAKAAHWYEQGDLLGYMDSTGFSTGSHLHFGIRPYESQDGNNWKQMFMNNGYKGYIDPEPFMPHMVWDLSELINEDNIKNFMATNEKKIIAEGEGKGRKGIIINGKLREIKKDRVAEACLYVLTNQTVSTKKFDELPKDKDF
jgi:murein DD-endopeptidase MepM/ murein hydrolase activator NlpD